MSENLYTLPQGWEWKKLPDVVLFGCQKGFNPPLIDGQVPFISMSDIDGKQGRKTQYILEPYEKVSSGKTKFQKNAVLVGKITPCTQNNKVSIVPDDIEGGFATTEVFALHCLDKMLPLFLNYYVRSDAINKLLVNSMIGATGRQRVPTETLKNLDIPLPPLEEQRRIVGVLDGLFGKIDKSIALLAESIASASSLIPSALNEVFEELGEKWEKESIEKIAQIIDGDRGENYPKKDEFFEKEYCLFLSAKNVTKNGFAFKENQFITKEKDAILRKGRLQKYDLVLTTRGTIGNVAFFDDSVPFEIIRLNSGMVILRVFNENINHKFLYIFLNSPIFESFLNEIQNGAAQPQISIRNFKSLQIPLPPLDIQTQTVAYLDALHVKADALKKAQEKKKEALLALKASLLESAFKGEL